MTKTFESRVSAIVATLTTVAAVTKLAGSIKKRADNLDVDMHSAGIGALLCAMNHRDTSAASAVTNSLGKHTRSKAFAEWIEKHSNVRLVLDKKTSLWAGKMADADERMTDDKLAEAIVTATAAPFWSVEEKSATDFSLHLALRALLKKGETARAKGTLSDEDRLAMVELQALTDKTAPKPEVAQSTTDVLESVG